MKKILLGPAFRTARSDNAVGFRVELELSFRLVRVVDGDLLRRGETAGAAAAAQLVVEEEQQGEIQPR